MKIKKIIIIDDDLEYTNEMEELLVQKDFEIIKKNNTDDILNFVKKSKPDLVILDLKINGLTGIDVARILKNDIKTKELPIMFLTNYYDDNDSEFNNDKIQLGISICLKKSIEPEILINEIRKIESSFMARGNKRKLDEIMNNPATNAKKLPAAIKMNNSATNSEVLPVVINDGMNDKII